MAKSKAMRMVGVDVSAGWLDVSCGAAAEALEQRQYPNTVAGQWGCRGHRWTTMTTTVVELATSSLGSWHSTAELRPRAGTGYGRESGVSIAVSEVSGLPSDRASGGNARRARWHPIESIALGHASPPACPPMMGERAANNVGRPLPDGAGARAARQRRQHDRLREPARRPPNLTRRRRQFATQAPALETNRRLVVLMIQSANTARYDVSSGHSQAWVQGYRSRERCSFFRPSEILRS